jgi:hypothetical protein
MSDNQPASQFPTGYVFDQAVIDENVAAFGAMGVDLHTGKLNGTCERKIDAGVCYENIRDFEADYLKPADRQHTRTGRRITPGGILEPILQKTGICVGCGFSAAQWLAWVARYVATGTGPIPQEVSLVGPYLLGRANIRGDNGAYPSYSARGSHDVGILTVEALCRAMRIEASSMTTAKQEEIAVEKRDNPTFPGLWLDAMEPLKTRVYKPNSAWATADCLASLYLVPIGMGWQVNEPLVSGDGISSWYHLNGGHETLLDGWFTRGGRLGFLKSESWGQFPASKWPEHRITIQTDDGPKRLYEGQCACMADELWSHGPEPWAIGYPGSVA